MTPNIFFCENLFMLLQFHGFEKLFRLISKWIHWHNCIANYPSNVGEWTWWSFKMSLLLKVDMSDVFPARGDVDLTSQLNVFLQLEKETLSSLILRDQTFTVTLNFWFLQHSIKCFGHITQSVWVCVCSSLSQSSTLGISSQLCHLSSKTSLPSDGRWHHKDYSND